MIRKLLIVRGNRRGDNIKSQAIPLLQNDDIFFTPTNKDQYYI